MIFFHIVMNVIIWILMVIMVVNIVNNIKIQLNVYFVKKYLIIKMQYYYIKINIKSMIGKLVQEGMDIVDLMNVYTY